jgi:monoamine oxidase
VTSVRHCDVAVVGAGIAGLTAARSLADAGLTVSVHEARDRVGGRLLSSTQNGQAVDLGATWFWPNEPLVQSLADELGVATFSQQVAGDALFEPDARGAQRLSGNPIGVLSGRFAQGAQALALGLAKRLPAGTLHVADPVAGVHVGDAHVVLQVAGGHVEADHVVLAISPALAVDSIEFTPELPDRVRSIAASTAVWMGAVVKTVAVYDWPFWRDAGLAGAAISHVGPFRELHDHSGPDGTPAAIFGFAGSDRFAGAMNDEIAAAFTGQLVRLFGPHAANPRQLHHVDWSRERYTSPATPSPVASTAAYSHPEMHKPVHGRLHWGSTETAPDFAGHIEGAIRAGARAASAIVQLSSAAANTVCTP